MTREINKNFKQGLIESIKVAGQMLIDKAEDIVGEGELISNLNVSIDFDQVMESIPELIITRSHVPSREKLEYLLDIYHGREKKDV